MRTLEKTFFNHNWWLIDFFIVIVLNKVKKENQPKWLKKYSDNEAYEMLDNPPMFYAPHTFWFWDDTIKDEQLVASMVEEMIKQNLNPEYIHPRSGRDSIYGNGNIIPAFPKEEYLSTPWPNSFNNALQKDKENNLTLGYCDNYEWSSGSAAGKVLQEHPEPETTYLSPKHYLVKGETEVKFEIPSLNDFEERKAFGTITDEASIYEDKVMDDTALVYNNGNGLFIITGCSHSGICNIIEYAKQVCKENKILGVIGGFHLFGVSPQLEKTINYFLENNIRQLYPCHCVSFDTKAEIHKYIPIHEVGVGLTITIE